MVLFVPAASVNRVPSTRQIHLPGGAAFGASDGNAATLSQREAVWQSQ
jgi:hypothetical protein